MQKNCYKELTWISGMVWGRQWSIISCQYSMKQGDNTTRWQIHHAWTVKLNGKRNRWKLTDNIVNLKWQLGNGKIFDKFASWKGNYLRSRRNSHSKEKIIKLEVVDWKTEENVKWKTKTESVITNNIIIDTCNLHKVTFNSTKGVKYDDMIVKLILCKR